MNERIRELAEQAGMLYTLDSKPTHIDENGTHTFQEINVYKNFDPEKFAELIVRECVIRAEREWIRNGPDTEHNKAITGVIKSIKEHFGVES